MFLAVLARDPLFISRPLLLLQAALPDHETPQGQRKDDWGAESKGQQACTTGSLLR